MKGIINDVETLCNIHKCPNKWADNDGGAWCYGCEVLEMTSTEQDVYELLCTNCPQAKKCHEECVTCERFDRVVEAIDGIEE